MSKLDEITRESWILGAFPEWGTWLNEEIDQTVVKPGTFAMRRIGNCGLWVKSEGNTDVAVDLRFGNGKRTQKVKDMVKGHQMRNMAGVAKLQPNRRAAPIVIDPFAITKLDAYLCTHIHSDHLDPFICKAILDNVEEEIPFIGPKLVVKKWIEWGVPEDRCIIVKPGDEVKVKDITITALDSFDRTCLVTTDGEVDIKGVCPSDMDDKAVNWLIETPAGNVYHAGDSHFSIGFAEHGKNYDIDIALGSYGENPIGMQDKMSSSDILRMADSLRCKVVIPIHYDVRTNFKADPKEIKYLYDYKKDKMQYPFTPYIRDVGGKYVWPTMKDEREYRYRPGFEDHFEHERNVPFHSIL